ncbi:MAG TPA: branched-chain amino acid ABC transporter permease [Marinobacterium sp.]|nr:branched-chain amino acid ABC transporter permease [Marinobacterium sp.]
MSSGDYKALALSLALLLIAICLPWVVGDFTVTLAVNMAMFTVLATSWALFSGPTHYISLATAAFFGLGTYTMALGLDFLPYWVLIPLAGLFGALMAGIIGLATLRLSGVYFVIFTLGLAEMTRQIITFVQNATGQKGILISIWFEETTFYWMLVGLAALIFLLGWLIGRSRLGFALRIIGDDEEVARHSGINTSLSKVMLFMIPGAAAAMTGALIAPRYGYIEPLIAFTPMLSFQVVIMALLGGTGRLWGPLVGVIPFSILWEIISASFPNQTTLLLGLSFLLIVYLLPQGFVGLLLKIKAKLNNGGGS